MPKRIAALSDHCRNLGSRLREERGFGLIEVVVSALLLAILSVGLFAGVDSAQRSSAQERHRSQADSVAQADQARLRGLPISQLTNMNQTRTVVQDGSTYTVVSKARFVSDTSAASSDCSTTGTADYIAMSSTVTWSTIGTRPPIVEEGQLTPPGAATGTGRGALAVQVSNSRVPPTGVGGVNISLSGASSASGVTNASGCLLLTNLVAGTYTLTPSAPAGYVDKDGNAPAPVTTSVINASTYSQSLMYDRAGGINVSFTARLNGSTLSAAKADTIQVFNSGMTIGDSYGTVNSPQTTLSATPLFPFTSPDSVYAGSCTADDPSGLSPAGPAGTSAAATVPQGGVVAATIQLAALQVTALKGGSGSPATADPHVKITDENHAGGGTCGGTRTFTATPTGPVIIALPYGTYDVCVDGLDTSGSSGSPRHVTWNNLAVTNMASWTQITALMGSPSGSPSANPVAGVCP